MTRIIDRAGMLAGALLLSGSSAASAAVTPACRGLLSHDVVRSAETRFVTPQDLARLRDFGSAESSVMGLSGASISPDGGSIALQLRRADPQSNSYCLAILVLSSSPGAAPRIVDAGGEFINWTLSRRGMARLGVGLPAPVIPHWSRDGRWLVFLRRDGGSTQVWRALADGTRPAERITHLASDIEDVAWIPGSDQLVLSTRPGLAAFATDTANAGLAGFRYDDRFSPMVDSLPLPSEPIAREYLAVDPSTGAIRQATANERAGLDPVTSAAVPAGARLSATASDGARAWVVPRFAGRFAAPDRLNVAFGTVTRSCFTAACSHIAGIWWSPDGRELRFLARAGWAQSELAFYRWPRDASAPHMAWSIDHLLIGCQPLGGALLCGEEHSEQPRQLVLIDPVTGRSTLLFDPDIEFRQLRLGAVRRLRWRNAYGIESFGDLVLPPEYRPGERVPLIVVQYRSKGFLRGGTGDEVPIQSFAARGYAVLSFERPEDIASRSRARTEAEYDRLDFANWADRRSVQSSLEGGVQLAVSLGFANPKAVGLTGLSDGAATAQWALVNSDIFRAAAISSCEDESVMALGGPVLADLYHERGFPRPGPDSGKAWRPYALSSDVARVRAPILLQSADREYLATLTSVTALQAAGKPVDLYVFPDEYHIKWQPAHRLAVYERTLDWFDFWLRGIEDPDPAKHDQYEHWRALKRLTATQSPPFNGAGRSTPGPKLPRPQS